MNINIPKGMKLNPNKERVNQVKKNLEANHGYCPCQLLKNEDPICPCVQVRENQKCICKLFVKEEN